MIPLMIAGAAASVAGNAISSKMNADAARAATRANLAAQQRALDAYQAQSRQNREAYAPTVAAGNAATSQLLNFLQNYKAPVYNGPTTFSFDKFQDPASRTQMMLTQRGLDASSAASGGGGGAQRALATELANNANTAYQQALNSFATQANVGNQGYQRGLDANNQLMGGLLGLSSLGMSALNSQQSLQNGLTGNIAGVHTGMGDTASAGGLGTSLIKSRGVTGLFGGLSDALSSIGAQKAGSYSGLNTGVNNSAINPGWAGSTSNYNYGRTSNGLV